ncbi:MAG TPA: uracil-DNA glycosylase [Eubacteriales bacterium]|nr:uracil-DNA glycosylase [Eubacteriales bacterium]
MPGAKRGDETRALLDAAYRTERDRLLLLAERDDPQGEYASPVFGEGALPARVLLIGEAPGAEETKQGRPFVGRAGRQLDALFGSFGITREAAYITNTVKYRPVVRTERSVRNRTPKPREVEEALPVLLCEIESIRPAFVLTLGNTPLKAVYCLCGQKPDVVGALHGERIPLIADSVKFELIPLYHPASGIYNRALVEVMKQDAQKVGLALRR